MAESTAAMQHMKKRLDEYMSEQSSATAPAAVAQTIANDFPADAEDHESYLGPVWQTVTKSAQDTPYHHPAQDKLVKMVSEIMLLPNDQEIRIWDEAHKWNELPLLGAEFRDMINGPEMADSEAEQGKINSSWVNFHAFAARLNGKGVTDWWDIPLWMLRQGLEEDLSAEDKLHDCHVMTAAQIIEHSGAIMLASKVMAQEKLDDQDKRMFAAGSLFKGEPGYSLERWTFWSRRLREEAEKCKSDEVKNAALRAAQLMDIWHERSKAHSS